MEHESRLAQQRSSSREDRRTSFNKRKTSDTFSSFQSTVQLKDIQHLHHAHDDELAVVNNSMKVTFNQSALMSHVTCNILFSLTACETKGNGTVDVFNAFMDLPGQSSRSIYCNKRREFVERESGSTF
jgi:hypothetical protein